LNSGRVEFSVNLFAALGIGGYICHISGAVPFYDRGFRAQAVIGGSLGYCQKPLEMEA